MVDLNELESDCAICIVSKMPMPPKEHSFVRPRRERTVPYANDFQTPLQLGTNLSNDFKVRDWSKYFKIVSQSIAERVNSVKKDWCQGNFEKWVTVNRHLIENKNIEAEVHAQSFGPLVSANLHY